MSDSAASAAPSTTVHLLRHGEVHNPAGVLYGRLPSYRLSDLGVRMAEVVADRLRDHDITLIVSSPLERAQQTARPLAELLDLPITTDDRLIEAGNRFEGRTFGVGNGSLRHPAVWPWLYNPVQPSWGEPYKVIAARMFAAVATAREQARGHEAVCVSHQLPIWTARSAAQGRRLWHDPRRRECALASLTSLSYVGDDLVAVTYDEPARDVVPHTAADTDHLDAGA
jgi:broad specificity phosphatase PhoE